MLRVAVRRRPVRDGASTSRAARPRPKGAVRVQVWRVVRPAAAGRAPDLVRLVRGRRTVRRRKPGKIICPWAESAMVVAQSLHPPYKTVGMMARMPRFRVFFVAAVCVAVCSTGARGAEPADTPEFFEKKIRPVLVEHCFKCHCDRKGRSRKAGCASTAALGCSRAATTGRRRRRRARQEPADRGGSLSESRPADAAEGEAARRGDRRPGRLGEGRRRLAGRRPRSRDDQVDLRPAKAQREHWAWQPVRAARRRRR